MKTIGLSLILVSFFMSVAVSASINKAVMLKQHGLSKEAKVELIEVIFGKSNDVEKAQAYYILGTIAFEENRLGVALDSWRVLSKEYPNSKQAKLVKDRIDEISGIVDWSTRELIENSVALSYLRHGDFWSKGKEDEYVIDLIWIPKVEAAIKWYDKVIKEYPKSPAARVAYQEKMKTLLGWEEPGLFGRDKYGIRTDYAFDKYMAQLLETFEKFKDDFPNTSSLQAFRYQIAQAYWGHKDWAKTREWLNLIIREGGKGESFYTDLAQRRLKKVEY